MSGRIGYTAVAAGLAAAVALPAGASAPRARVALADRDPVVVAGRGFVARERVTVRVIAAGANRLAKVVRARTNGTFRAVFGQQSIDRCAAYAITAVGAKGSRAVGKQIDPPPACGIVIIP